MGWPGSTKKTQKNIFNSFLYNYNIFFYIFLIHSYYQYINFFLTRKTTTPNSLTYRFAHFFFLFVFFRHKLSRNYLEALLLPFMCFDDHRFTSEYIKVITANSNPFNNKYHQPPPKILNHQSFSFVTRKRKRSSGDHNKTKCTSSSGNVSALLFL